LGVQQGNNLFSLGRVILLKSFYLFQDFLGRMRWNKGGDLVDLDAVLNLLFDRGIVDLLNFLATLFLIEESLEVVSMSHPDLKIAKMKSQANSPKGSSCLMLFALHPSRFLCLRKHTMC